jgi:hypothetical protein
MVPMTVGLVAACAAAAVSAVAARSAQMVDFMRNILVVQTCRCFRVIIGGSGGSCIGLLTPMWRQDFPSMTLDVRSTVSVLHQRGSGEPRGSASQIFGFPTGQRF